MIKIFQHLSFLSVIALASVLIGGCAPALKTSETPQPDWLMKTLYEENGHYFVIGHSKLYKSENEAKLDALVSATSLYITHFGFDLNTFDKTVELYSKLSASSLSTMDVDSKNLMRTRSFIMKAVPIQWNVIREANDYRASVLVRIPHERHEMIKAGSPDLLMLDIFLFYEDHVRKMHVLADDSAIESRDAIGFYLRPSDDCYVYIFQKTGDNPPLKLYPSRNFGTPENPLPLANDTWLPNNEELYELGGRQGVSSIYVIASKTDVQALTGNALDDYNGNMDYYLKDLGIEQVDYVLKWDTDFIQFPMRHLQGIKVNRKLQSEGAFYYKRKFLIK